jgi:hypothetical protein
LIVAAESRRLLDDVHFGAAEPAVISLSAPLRITIARIGDPDSCIAAVKPCAIESTETSTTTTPAMPTTATLDDPSRRGIVRRLSDVTATVCAIQLNI